MSIPPPPYQPRRPSRSVFVELRGLRYHVRHWGDPGQAASGPPPLVLLHGWMDTGASFQFMVDALAELEGDTRQVLAPDWRGFGLTANAPGVDSYWFPDYLGDLDALVAPLLSAAHPRVDLLGHSMGGNVAMVYAGVRPQRVRRLVDLEGFGQPAAPHSLAPGNYARWLDELAAPAVLQPYAGLAQVVARLQRNNPLLPADRAHWLATQWARQDDQGRWQILADPAHKHRNPVLYRVEEVLACWERIEAPMLWVEGDRSDLSAWWGDRYSKAEFHERLRRVGQCETARLSPAGHMLHHDQPEALARRLKAFLDAG